MNEINPPEPSDEAKDSLSSEALQKIEATSGKGAPSKVILCTKGVSLRKIVEMSK